MKAALVHRFAFRLLATFVAAAPAAAQEPKSAMLARELAAALDAAKLQDIAAKAPGSTDRYVAALYFQNLQLIVVSGTYQAPALLDDRLTKREYRDIYVELNGASDPKSRVFVTDLGIDGLRARPAREQPADSYESSGKRTMFNREWDQQKLTEDDYNRIYVEADAEYVELLTALLAQAKAAN
jgi:hypothetical protein